MHLTRHSTFILLQRVSLCLFQWERPIHVVACLSSGFSTAEYYKMRVYHSVLAILLLTGIWFVSRFRPLWYIVIDYWLLTCGDRSVFIYMCLLPCLYPTPDVLHQWANRKPLIHLLKNKINDGFSEEIIFFNLPLFSIWIVLFVSYPQSIYLSPWSHIFSFIFFYKFYGSRFNT